MSTGTFYFVFRLNYFYILLLFLLLLLLLLLFVYYYLFIFILESKKKVEKKVGRLWEAREGAPQSISIESENTKVWGGASHASHSLP